MQDKHKSYFLVPLLSAINVEPMMKKFDCGNTQINEFFKQNSFSEKAKN